MQSCIFDNDTGRCIRGVLSIIMGTYWILISVRFQPPCRDNITVELLKLLTKTCRNLKPSRWSPLKSLADSFQKWRFPYEWFYFARCAKLESDVIVVLPLNDILKSAKHIRSADAHNKKTADTGGGGWDTGPR